MKSAPSLSVSSEQRGSLEKMARSTSLPHRGVVQAKALLWAADGVANEEIARRCGVDSDAVRRWRRRFSELGVAGVGVIAKGRGRRSWLPEGTVAEVVRVTLEETPDDTSTHWTTRSLAKRFGIGKDTVARIWQDHHLQPWKVDTFKISTDPRFEEKLVDVVGLYLDPPERAVVFSFDEKTQCQALDRTQPSLPMKPGRAGTMTHDYKRNGTTDLFAALNVATGEVLYDCRRAPHRQGRTPVLQAHQPPRRPQPRHPRGVQPFSPHGSRGHRLVGPPQTGSLAPALHPHQLVLAEHHRALVQRTHRPSPTPCSPAWPTSSMPSRSGPNTGTTTPSPSSGTRPPKRSSQRSAADEPPSTRSNPRRTTRPIGFDTQAA